MLLFVSTTHQQGAVFSFKTKFQYLGPGRSILSISQINHNSTSIVVGFDMKLALHSNKRNSNNNDMKKKISTKTVQTTATNINLKIICL